MNKKVKKELGIILAITVIVLVITFVVLSMRAKHFIDVWDDLANIEPNEDPEEVNIAAAAIGLLAIISSLVGVTMYTLVYPTVITAALLAIFLIVVLCVKKEKTQRVVVLVLLPFSLLFGITTLLGELDLFLLYWITLQQASNMALSIVIMAILVLSAICLISSIITVIVSCARLNRYCKKEQQQQPVACQQALLTQ